jgi:hypothetical protein
MFIGRQYFFKSYIIKSNLAENGGESLVNTIFTKILHSKGFYFTIEKTDENIYTFTTSVPSAENRVCMLVCAVLTYIELDVLCFPSETIECILKRLNFLVDSRIHIGREFVCSHEGGCFFCFNWLYYPGGILKI